MQLRVRMWNPLPHRRLQADQSDQSDHDASADSVGHGVTSQLDISKRIIDSRIEIG